MPYLGDYLGQLLSEITLARMHADLETVRLAELYASHPLLRHLPVPHVRLPDVELELPVVIKEAEEPRAEESPRGGLEVRQMRRTFDRLLQEHLARVGVRVTAPVNRKLQAELDAHMETLTAPRETAVDVRRAADDLTATAFRVLGGESAPLAGVAEAAAQQAEVQARARIEFLKLRRPPPRLFALVTTAEIREAGPAESLSRLRLKITEQGVEWTTIESEGRQEERLLPE